MSGNYLQLSEENGVYYSELFSTGADFDYVLIPSSNKGG
jgi:hypothetical protein